MKISAWRKVSASAFVAALVVGCVVSGGDDDNEEDSGVSGSGGKGGSGGSTGGKAGTGGSAGSTAGTGGSAGSTAPFTCEPKDGGSLGSTPGASCAPQSDSGDICQACVQMNCCDEWKACIATRPNNPCGFGSPVQRGGSPIGEITCFQECIFDALDDGGTASQDTQRICAGNCTSPGCGTPAGATSDLIACLDDQCFTECLQN